MLTAIDRVLASFQDSYNAHNPFAVAALYTEDARWLAAAGPVLEGRAAITTALQQFMIAVPPVLTLSGRDKVVIGNHALAVGTYALTGAVAGESPAIGGSYLNVLRQDGKDWRIASQQMNYDFQVSAANWVGRIEVVQALPEAGRLAALAEALERGYNSGNWSQMANLFTADGWTSCAGAPLVSGRAAIERVFRQNVAEALRLDIHAVSTLQLGDGMAADVGWYELTAGVDQVRWGTYSLLARQNAEGEWLIHWLVATGSPAGANVF